MKVYSLIPFMKNTLSSRCHGSFISLFMKISFMQNSYYTALKPPSASGLYRPTNSCEYVVLSLALLLITCFRGRCHQSGRWVLCGHRRVVWGSQVAAWDVGTSWHGLCLCVGLLGHIFGSCCTRQLLCFRMMYCWVCDPPFVCNLYLSHI